MTPEETEQFVSLLTSSQADIYRYVLALVAARRDRASDILQEANLVMWRKADSYTFGTDFGAWARKIAYYCVLSDVRNRQRSMKTCDARVLESLSAEYQSEAAETQHRRDRLEHCLKKLSVSQRTTLKQRYQDGLSVTEIARRGSRSVDAVSALLYRTRLALTDCVKRPAGIKQ